MAEPTPPFPGAIGVSHLRVYDSEAPDGLRGGTPHVHLACTEAYAVAAGRGVVQTLSGGGYAETAIEAGSFVWFTPGTIHRLVNLDGRLEIFVLMQNAGLPEAGDMVFTFPADVLADEEAYRVAAELPADERTTAGSGAAARRRRDLAVTGFGALRDAVDREGHAALRAFHERAAALVRGDLPRWRGVWERGPLTEARRTGEHLAALASADASHLAGSAVHALPPPGGERRMGCCGTLGVYVVGA